MEIFLNEIPEEGLQRSGQFQSSLFDLDEKDSIRSVGPVEYDVTMYRFEDIVAFSGVLRAPFQLQCAICLDYVDYQADFESWSSELDLEEGQKSFDLSQVIREDFLLELPASPFCEDLDPDRICPKAELIQQIEEESARDPGAESGPDVWGALDDLK